MKIASYTVELRESYIALSIEAWQRDDGSLCLYVWPLKSLDVGTDPDGVFVDWTGPDNYFAAGAIGDVYAYPEVCQVVPEPGLAMSLCCGVVLCIGLKRWKLR